MMTTALVVIVACNAPLALLVDATINEQLEKLQLQGKLLEQVSPASCT